MAILDMLIFASFTPEIGRYQEYKRGIEKVADLFDLVLSIANGEMTVPKGPGTGIIDYSHTQFRRKHLWMGSSAAQIV